MGHLSFAKKKGKQDQKKRFNECNEERLEKLKLDLRRTVYDVHRVYLDDLSLHICLQYLDFKWVWHTLCDGYEVIDNGLSIRNVHSGDSSWSRWAYTQPFPTQGVHTLSIKINQKRLDQGWLGIGVIRKSFVEKTKTKEGGFKIYSNHAIFVDPSWNAI